MWSHGAFLPGEAAGTLLICGRGGGDQATGQVCGRWNQRCARLAAQPPDAGAGDGGLLPRRAARGGAVHTLDDTGLSGGSATPSLSGSRPQLNHSDALLALPVRGC